MDNAELAHAPTYRLAELIAAKEVSPVEATQLYLDRIEAMDSQLNSYLTVTAEEALEAARSAEEQVARGDDLGPLHGVPIGIKDLQMTKGIRTTGGSLAYKDRVPDADSAVVERVLASGAIILGKTNTPEFGLLGANENLLGDDCRNPLESGAHLRGVQRRRGRGSGGRPVLHRDGRRRRRLYSHPGQLLRHLRHQALAGPGVQLQRRRGSPARQLHQPAGPHVPHRARLGHSAPGARRP